MKKIVTLAWILLFALSAQSQRTIYLFNGTNLRGWTVYGTEKWYVEKGSIVCESGSEKKYGYLVTDSVFRNFELTLRFKQEAEGNSGVFFRSSINGLNASGWQVEVATPNGNTGAIYEANGRGWLAKPQPDAAKYLKPGKWNALKIQVLNDRITTWLNGHQMIDMADTKIGMGKGHIALQVHEGGDVKLRWKDIILKEL